MGLEPRTLAKGKTQIEACDIIEEPIFYNVNIKRDNQIVHIKEWESVGILKIKDVFNGEGQCMDYMGFKEKYPTLNSNFMLCFGVITAIQLFMNNVNRIPGKSETLLSNEMLACIRKGNNCVKNKLLE